jgi:hypothetical protein
VYAGEVADFQNSADTDVDGIGDVLVMGMRKMMCPCSSKVSNDQISRVSCWYGKSRDRKHIRVMIPLFSSFLKSIAIAEGVACGFRRKRVIFHLDTREFLLGYPALGV